MVVKKITYGKNVYNKLEINAVLETLKKTTQMGKKVELFEKKIAKIFGKKYGVMVNSGSSALIIAIRLLNLKKNSEIITPCLNFGTAISSILLNQCRVKLVDIKKETLQIDEAMIEKKINSKTKALLIPNLIGNIPDWIKIKKIAEKYKLKIIEDSADTLGARIKKKPTGTYSDISITSFYGSHIISCAGNGGILLLNNKKMFKRARILRSWGRQSSIYTNSENIKKRLNYKLQNINYDNKFVFTEIGYNFEPSEVGAAFGLVQLKKFKTFESIRKINFLRHRNFFQPFPEYFIMPSILKDISTNFLSYPVIIRSNNYFTRNELQKFLEGKNIQTRPIFSGNILRHPAFTELLKYNKINNFKNADYIMENGMLLGCHQGLSKTQIDYIHQNILYFIKQNEKKYN